MLQKHFKCLEIDCYWVAFSIYGQKSSFISNDYHFSHLIQANGIPDHYPYQVVNPNNATPQSYSYTVPETVTIASTPGCLDAGVIGLTRTGVAIFSPLGSPKTNAVEGTDAETFDACDGHATNRGIYHYHKIPDSCLYNGDVDEFIGVALDGIAIYGPNATWKTIGLVNSADLDACNGGSQSGAYSYYVTEDWPYFLGCYKGVVHSSVSNVEYTCASSSCKQSTYAPLS